MSISLAGPTTATTTAALTAATYSFVSDMANDNRSKVFVMSAKGGTQTGVNIHTVDSPKYVVFKRPAQFQQASGYNTVSGKYSRVPKNVTRVVGKGSCNVTASQIESIPMELSIGVPAGGPTFDRVNVEASILMFLSGIWDQREEIVQAVYDGLY